MKLTSVLCLICGAAVVACAGCASTRTVAADSLVFSASTSWQPESPEHQTRLLQYRLPSGRSDVENAKLVVWNFPGMRDAGDGHIIARNMDRWTEQFDLGGRPHAEAVRKVEYLINGLPVHTIDISGRYKAETTPGSGINYDLPNYRMRGAYVTAPGGDYIIKLVGPASVVARHSESFDTFIRSVRTGDGSVVPGAHTGRTELAAMRGPS